MADIKIVVDTSADMTDEMLEKYDIGQVNFLTIFGDDAYVAGKEITNEEFYKRLVEENVMPTTAQTPYTDLYDYLLQESKKHETVIYFTISQKASGQNHTAHMIVDEIKENDNPNADIRIVDSKRFSVYISSAAMYATELVKEGKSADEIIEKCEEYMQQWKTYLLVDSLKYLEKGGRINKATAIVGTVLDIKPVLTVRNGLIEQADKLRGKKKIYQKIVALMKDDPEFDETKKEFMIAHSDKAAGDAMVETLKEEYGDVSIKLFSEFGPIVGTHTGPGCFAVLFRVKEN